jgi:hypothetical protein
MDDALPDDRRSRGQIGPIGGESEGHPVTIRSATCSQALPARYPPRVASNSSATMLMILIIGLIAGPAVSL